MGRKKKEETVTVEKDTKEEEGKTAKAKKSAIMNAMRAVQKTFGEDAAFLGGDNSKLDIEAVPTGSLGLDNAIGVGGFPRGRVVEISGMEASGKTLVSLGAIAQVQKAGGTAVFVDMEHALTPKWVRSQGVNYEDLIIVQPDYAEQALDIIQKFVEAEIDIIVLDSVASMATKAEVEGTMEQNHMGVLARVMGQGLRKLTPIISKSRTVCIFINQIRENIGQMYGPKEVTPGGKALKFFASVRLKVRKKSGSEIKANGKDPIGHTMIVKVLKNKVAVPFKEAEFVLYYESGIDKVSELAELSIKKNVVTRPNNRRYEYTDNAGTEHVWSSRAEFDAAIAGSEVIAGEFLEKIKKAMSEEDEEVDIAVEEVGGNLVDLKTGEILDTAEQEENIDA